MSEKTQLSRRQLADCAVIVARARAGTSEFFCARFSNRARRIRVPDYFCAKSHQA